MDLLRVSTAGSVDDGKSTLLGRLLYDTKSIFEDQLETLKQLSRDDELDLALLTDGLRAEREQKITIDVAYRYFATPNRKFILADTPGHFEYTRNMITGCSTAELAIILIDARNGVTTQSRRHGFIASLLRVPHLLVAINKMDLVGYEQAVFERWRDEYKQFADKLEVPGVTFVPISALKGDNVVDRSANMPWYQGPTLLHLLESVKVGASHNVVDFRFPVQYVVRPDQNFRGVAGQVHSGKVAPGDEVTVLPSGLHTTVQQVYHSDGEAQAAGAGESVILTLADEVDVSRGSMIVRRRNQPAQSSRLDAMVCWMTPGTLEVGKEYWLQHTTRRVKAQVEEIVYRIDVDTLHHEQSPQLHLNDIGRVVLRTSSPVFFDPYQANRATGNFILIDPATNNTVGAGMIRGEAERLPEDGGAGRSSNVVWEQAGVSLSEREDRAGHKAAVVWFTGLSGSGKSTVAKALERRLFEAGRHTMHLDGDNLRHGLNGDLGFSAEDRTENLRRAAHLARVGFDHGQIVLGSFISPLQEHRQQAASLFPQDRFFLVHVDCPLEVCRSRDPKGLYQRASNGEIPEFTGVGSPYEVPLQADLTVDTSTESVESIVDRLMEALQRAGILPERGL